MSTQGQRCGSHGGSMAVVAAFLGMMAAAPVVAQCTTNAECADADFCTIDTCFNPGPNGECIHTPWSCSDGVYCNGAEQCDEARDSCEFACLGGTVCESGFCVCNQQDGCPSGNAGMPCDVLVQPVNCNSGQVCNEDLNACTECFHADHCAAPEPRCNTATGECVQCFLNSHCVDTLYCNGQETCNVGTGFCEPGSPVECDFPQFCSELLDRCAQCENNVQCDDGLYCNGEEACIDDACQPGTPVDCAAMNPATPHCNESGENCVACLTDAHCDDDKFCTSDSCNTLTHECNNEADPEQYCYDDLFCNGLEQCNATNTGCVPGTPPACGKTCFQGPTPGAACTADSQCGKACKQGNRAGLSCATDADCNKACAGGSNDGQFCAVDDECESRNCTSRGLCATGLCRGGCSESNNVCVQCAPDVPNSIDCTDGLYCDGLETCNPQTHQCVAAPRPYCEAFNSQCTKGLCNETTDACGPTNRPNETFCDDGDHCTVVDECQNGVCVAETIPADDPYRCVELELVPGTTGNVTAGSTVEVRLRAVAENCNVFSSDCPSSNNHPIAGLSALLDWDPTKLALQTATINNPNPQDPCNASTCVTCAAGTYDWSNSLFAFDCDGDGLNAPCSGTPANDGDASYVATSRLTCTDPQTFEPIETPPACVPPGGLHVTTFKFTVLSAAIGSVASVGLMPCAGEQSLSSVISNVDPPTGYYDRDVTKSLGPPATFNVVSCTSAANCNDDDPCTDDSCLGGSCSNTPKNCGDPDPCTIDSCNPVNGACSNTPIACGAGNRCYQGECFEVCTSGGECDDGVDCTDNVCQAVSGDDICVYAPNDSLCATGLFCSGERCDSELGCVFDHECFSANGNPCPDNGTCDEPTDTCGGCLAPAVTPTGCRYVRIVPADQGATPVAFLIEGDCSEPGVGCISQYVQSRCDGGPDDGEACVSQADCTRACVNGPTPGAPCVESFPDCGAGGTCAGNCVKGLLGTDPVFLTAAEWGTIQVKGLSIRPGSPYQVMTDCDFEGTRVLSAASDATTWNWGDTNGDSAVNVLDISTVVNAIKELWAQATLEGTNLWSSSAPCDVDDRVNVLDLSVTVDAVKAKPFPCASACP